MLSKIPVFAIVFDYPNSSYCPGQLVTGKVVLVLKTPLDVRVLVVDISNDLIIVLGAWDPSSDIFNKVEIRQRVLKNAGVKLKVKGEANVCENFESGKLDSEERRRVAIGTHINYEKYFEIKFYVLGSATGPNFTIPAGEHTYPFNFWLPKDLPSSFEHIQGYVEYSVAASLDRPWKLQQETKITFNVIAAYDLNEHPSAKVAINEEDEECFCYCCCLPGGSVATNISIPISGFVPGQIIPVKVAFDNRSRINVTQISMKLIQALTFHPAAVRGETRFEWEIVKEEKLKGPFASKDDVMLLMQVPPLPSSDLEFCKIIDISYSVLVKIKSGRFASIEKRYPIVIGTVPLSRSEQYSAVPKSKVFDDPEYDNHAVELHE